MSDLACLGDVWMEEKAKRASLQVASSKRGRFTASQHLTCDDCLPTPATGPQCTCTYGENAVVGLAVHARWESRRGLGRNVLVTRKHHKSHTSNTLSYFSFSLSSAHLVPVYQWRKGPLIIIAEIRQSPFQPM